MKSSPSFKQRLTASSLVFVLALALGSAGCEREPLNAEFPGYSKVTAAGSATNLLVDLSSAKREQGIVSFSLIETLDRGYVIRTTRTDCLKTIQRGPGVQFRKDGTSEREAPADAGPIDMNSIAGLREAAQLSCDRANKNRSLFGSFEDGAALKLIFGNYDAKSRAAIWRDLVVPARVDAAFLGQEAAVRPALSEAFIEGGVSKRVLITSATQNSTDVECHACPVMLGVFIFVNVASEWRLEQEQPFFRVAGAWGKAPEVKWLKLSDSRWALLINQADMHQGTASNLLSLSTVDTGKEVQLLSYEAEGDERRGNPSSSFAVMATKDAGLSDVKITVRWSSEITPASTSEVQELHYRYDGARYVELQRSPVAVESRAVPGGGTFALPAPLPDSGTQIPSAVASSQGAQAKASSTDGERARALLDGYDAVAAEGQRFVVQVGAFADADAARETRRKVEELGFNTYTQAAQTVSGSRIRVRVGPFASRVEAESAMVKAKAAGLSAVVLTF